MAANPAETTTSNDRFKHGFGDWFWVGLILATLIHAALFLASPTFGIEDYGIAHNAIVGTEIPDRIEIPPPPEAIARPVAPVMSTSVLDHELTIPKTTFEHNPVEDLAPPPGARGDEPDPSGTFTPMTIRPRLTNDREVQRALVRHYPPALRDAGIGGTVSVWFFIDEDGRVRETRVHRPSGYDAFDQAALRVAGIMEFTPAYNRDARVAVWVTFEIRFEVEQR